MPTRRYLILYGTHHGQTEQIARRIAEVLQSTGGITTLVNGRVIPSGLSPRDYDAVLIGGSVQFNSHQRFLRDFVRAHRDTLNAMPSAFFSVSGAGAGRTEADSTRARGYVGEFLSDTGWRPTLSAAIGGAMMYRRYNPLLRWVMKRIAARTGAPTDTSRNHSFTDWTQLGNFAAAFASIVANESTERSEAGTPALVH